MNGPNDPEALPPMAGSGREWIVEIPCRVVHTMTVRADTRKDAEAKLRKRSEHMDDFTGIDSHVTSFGIGRVVCEDGRRNSQNVNVMAPGSAVPDFESINQADR